jgi:hypothetical protein
MLSAARLKKPANPCPTPPYMMYLKNSNRSRKGKPMALRFFTRLSRAMNRYLSALIDFLESAQSRASCDIFQ